MTAMFPENYFCWITIITNNNTAQANIQKTVLRAIEYKSKFVISIHKDQGIRNSAYVKVQEITKFVRTQTMNEDLYNSYSLLLDRTARRVKQYAQQQFNEMGFNITVDQWVVLKHLYEKEGMKQNELADLLFKDNPTLTRIIDLLCEKGLTVRNLHPSDRRSFVVSLTKEGNKKVEQLGPRIRDIRFKAWDGLSERDFNQFKKILNTIYQNLG